LTLGLSSNHFSRATGNNRAYKIDGFSMHVLR